MTSRVAVIDYGMGNLRSVSKALEHVADQATVIVSSDPAVILAADRVVLPGVGALRDCMAELSHLGLDEVVKQCAKTKPFLGICLGMQALLDRSDENDGTEGLGIISGQAPHFSAMPECDGLKIPQMGWNTVHQSVAHPLWDGIADDSYFYFVHSYFVQPQSEAVIAGTTDYGRPYASAIFEDNVFAVQFHPEKSQHMGLKMLENFMSWDGAV